MAEKVWGVSAFALLALIADARPVFAAPPSAPLASTKSLEPSAAPAKRPEQVRTLSGGITLRIAAGSVVQNLPGTRLQLGAPGTPMTTTHVFQLVSGRMSVNVPAGGKSPSVAVLVRAPRRASAVVKGGLGVLQVTNESVTVAALQGEMLAALGDSWRALAAGNARSFDAQDSAGKPRRILRAPELNNAEPLVMDLGAGSGSARVAWNEVAGAASYRVSVLEPASSAPALQEFATKDTWARVNGLRPGKYRLSVSAVDRYGLDGPSSDSNVKVLGVEIPAGARKVEGGIELGPHQRIRFSDPEGLELSYGKASDFVPAPGEIGLSLRAPKLVRIREAGNSAELSFRLVPRDEHAQISIGPNTARWPRDVVKIRVELRDSAGRPLADVEKVSLDVRVNIDPVPVRWTRRGSVFEGTLFPRAQKGPWAVRVHVTNELGDEIGYGFLEVAE